MIKHHSIEPLEARIAPAFAAVFELSSLDGSNGFTINGVAAGDQLGASVSDAGDVNGDGFGDLIVGAHLADPNGADSGASYVVFGKASGFPANLDLATLDGTNGFKLSGVAAGDQSGVSVSKAGDINGDGFDDLIVGAYGASPNGDYSGASYVVFGKASGFGSRLNLSTLDGSNGFRLSGADADNSGISVSAAGDLNGDGFDDVIIGAFGADPNRVDSGASYVVFGKASGFAANLDLETLDGSDGFKLSGVAANDRSGFSVSNAGDVNGDGYDDLLIGASEADANGQDSGASYVVFGKASGFGAEVNLSTLNGSNGFRLSGAAPSDSFGRSVSAAGDVNGDGFDDVIVGAPSAAATATGSGATYVVFGKASGFAAEVNVSTLNGTNGFKLSGGAKYDHSGISVSAAGDFNGDGFGDLIIGADLANGGDLASGVSYLVFGKASGFAANLDLSELDGRNGFKLNGVASGDYSGAAVSAAGDVNGDGFDDLIIGAYGVATNGVYSGASYVVFGQALTIGDNKVVISADGKRAIFADSDGDLVTVTTSRGAFVQENFVFGPDGELLTIDLTASSAIGAFSGAKITAFAQTAGGGDGLVNVGAFEALGVNLRSVTIDGNLGDIDVGTGGPGNAALQSLIAHSMGLDAGVAPGAESTFAGRVGFVKIAHDVNGVLNFKGGPGSAAIDVAHAVVIGGNLDGSAGGPAAGLLRANGGIGRIVIKGHVIGGAEQSGIVVGGKLGTVKIRGDLRSDDAAEPVTISALGNRTATDAEQGVALATLTVGGRVLNAKVLAGYQRDGTPANPDAGIGRIAVAGNWSASSIAAGVADVTGDGFGRNDALIPGDATPELFARIASVVIRGSVTGSSASADHFGITAQQIGRIVAGSSRPAFTDGPDNVLLDPTNGDFRAVDFA